MSRLDEIVRSKQLADPKCLKALTDIAETSGPIGNDPTGINEAYFGLDIIMGRAELIGAQRPTIAQIVVGSIMLYRCVSASIPPKPGGHIWEHVRRIVLEVGDRAATQ